MMGGYSLDDVGKYGAPIVLRLLIESLKNGEPFVTYSEIRIQLQHKLNVDIIFPTHIGRAAGDMMNKILAIDPKAPLINTLVTRDDGVPGVGAAHYLEDRYSDCDSNDWGKVMSREEKLKIVERERIKIKKYKKWENMEKELFGRRVKIIRHHKKGTEKDGKPPVWKRGGGAESHEHKNLKQWVANNPRMIGLPEYFGTGELEKRLPSGDAIDVFFSYIANNSLPKYAVVEVKSCISDDLDFERGVYQCVKYRSVKEAQEMPYKCSVCSILVTERSLPSELIEKAKMLKVKIFVVSVN